MFPRLKFVGTAKVSLICVTSVAQPSLFLTRVQVADRDKRPSLLQPGLNYRGEKFFLVLTLQETKDRTKK